MNLTPDEYVNQLYEEDEQLRQVKNSIIEQGMPEVSVAPAYGRLLTLLVQTARAQNALEIGALGGYSGICIAKGLPANGQLLSLELKEEYAKLAKGNLESAGFGSNVDYMIGQALDSLEELKQAGRTFDFFFIDADKENYPTYLEYAIQLSKPGSLIVGDNCFLRGRTLNSEKNGPAVLGMRHFNEKVATDDRLVSTLLPDYDGLSISWVK
ncbi:O-methyltransferase [Paenibacillus macquariensis]|uniref:Predicted O-methyltransferase YrrM n=1 Tax=Paenibacillus macquariensis TaxID=948756 RepID=A0ABY1JY92_9BACL|nr:O-methyltransferase [Paenibacillus macquariensis]MEC0089166.1 O-methyltransferase [Paenibacillus macquariensis]OAB33414.1 methyltransferase [Paenibacillus macquariensis subsp. macquariensis]SIQ97330.1 Predicted O-methyltransferase YrrM [Paenibacillus macquariensis]